MSSMAGRFNPEFNADRDQSPVSEAQFLLLFGDRVQSVSFSRIAGGCEFKATYRLWVDSTDLQPSKGQG